MDTPKRNYHVAFFYIEEVTDDQVKHTKSSLFGKRDKLVSIKRPNTEEEVMERISRWVYKHKHTVLNIETMLEYHGEVIGRPVITGFRVIYY